MKQSQQPQDHEDGLYRMTFSSPSFIEVRKSETETTYLNWNNIQRVNVTTDPARNNEVKSCAIISSNGSAPTNSETQLVGHYATDFIKQFNALLSEHNLLPQQEGVHA